MGILYSQFLLLLRQPFALNANVYLLLGELDAEPCRKYTIIIKILKGSRTHTSDQFLFVSQVCEFVTTNVAYDSLHFLRLYLSCPLFVKYTKALGEMPAKPALSV